MSRILIRSATCANRTRFLSLALIFALLLANGCLARPAEPTEDSENEPAGTSTWKPVMLGHHHHVHIHKKIVVPPNGTTTTTTTTSAPAESRAEAVAMSDDEEDEGEAREADISEPGTTQHPDSTTTTTTSKPAAEASTKAPSSAGESKAAIPINDEDIQRLMVPITKGDDDDEDYSKEDYDDYEEDR